MEELNKLPISTLTKEQFNSAYELSISKYGNKLSKEQVLSLALQFQQITIEKFNELI